MSQPSRSSSLSSPAGPSSRATPSLDTTAAGTTPTTEWNLDGSPASLSFAANSTSTGSLSPFIHNRTFAAHTLNSTLGISTQAASSPIQRQRGMSQQNGNGNGNGTLGLGKKPTVDTEPPSPSPLTAPSHGSAPSPSPSPSPSHHPLLKNLSTGSLSSKSDSSTTSDHASATGSGQTGLANGRGRLLIVANRLPLSMKRSGENKEISFTPSSGGLVSALKGVKGTQMQWIGWPGAEVSSKKDQEVVKSQLKQHNALPVFLSQETCDLFYNGFCNNILWPLFHYIPLPIESLQMADAQFSAYEQANLKFAKVVLDNYRDGDTVWVHDYHLMLLPAMLRQSQPHMKIGFFLHTPFPSSEIFRVLPSRKELLLGVLASDLIGFHTHDYARHFQSSCVRFVGAASTGDIIKAEGLNSHLGTFPIGIDPQSFLKALDTTQVHNFQKDLEQKFGGKKVLLGIDRLDYIKGIPHKLYAFERFFEQNPDWIGKCVLVQIAIPSRTDVPEYQKLRSQTHELVGRVNGKFGSLDSVPIHYLDQSIPFDKMCALYRVSDVMVISSVRDGMNLVAYEYIACQKDRAGVLILSEFAGAGQSLGAGALSVNPWSITDLADAIKTALTMPMSERRERNAYAFKHVLTHTAQHWAETFVNALHATSGPASPVCDNEPLSIPPPLNFETVVTAFQSSKHRLIVTGLAGTLTENQKPEESFKEFERHVKASAKMQAAIKLLSQDPNTTLLVLTSRSRLMCDSVLGDTEAWQAAENGYFLRKGGKDQPWLMMHENLDLSWKEGVHRVFEYFTDRTPRTYIKDQETHMSWHYADAEPTFAKRQANDMISHLTGGPLSNTSTEVLDSSNIIQVRPLGVSKGIAIKQILNELNTWGKQKAYAWAENDKNPEFHTYPVAPNYIEDEMEEKETYHSSSINSIKNTNLNVNSLTNSPKVRRCSSSVSLRDLSRGTSGQHAHSHAHHHHDSIWSTESDAHHGTHTNRLLSQKRSHKLPPVDFVLCIGNFLDRDEDLFAVLNERAGHAGSPALGRNSRTGSRMTTPTPSSHTIASPSPSPDDEITLPQSVKHKEPSPSTSITNSPHSPATSIVAPHATSTTSTKGAHIFTCSVGEKPSHAQFFVPCVAQVETLLTQLATTLPSQNNNRLGLTLPSSAASITPTIQSPTPAPIQAVIPTGAH